MTKFNPVQANIKNVERLRQLSYMWRNLRVLHEQAGEDLEQVAVSGRGNLDDIKKKWAEMGSLIERLDTDFGGLDALAARNKEIDEIEQQAVYDTAEAANIAQIPEFARLNSPQFWTISLQEILDSAGGDQILSDALAQLPAEYRTKLAEMASNVTPGPD